MNTKTFFTGCLLAGFIAVGRAGVGDFQITLKVVDDSGKPVPGATVGVSFIQLKIPLAIPSVENTAPKKIDVVPDKNGNAVISDSNLFERDLYYGIKPLPGYYYTAGDKRDCGGGHEPGWRH